jgi:hypothetical protein
MPDNEIVEVSNAVIMLPPSRIIERARAIHEIMKEAMKDGIDYGVIQGCGSKPTLLKPGAEKLLMMFQVAPKVSVTDLCTPDVYRYRVLVSLVSQAGVYLGDGIGECSSLEKKWTRPNPADVANTVLKMAKKRALVDAVLTVLGASDIFTQDIEDMDHDQVADRNEGAPSTSKPQAKALAAKPQVDPNSRSTSAQCTFISHNFPVVGMSNDDLWDFIAMFAPHAKTLEDLTYSQAKEVIDRIKTLHQAQVDMAADKSKEAAEAAAKAAMAAKEGVA